MVRDKKPGKESRVELIARGAAEFFRVLRRAEKRAMRRKGRGKLDK